MRKYSEDEMLEKYESLSNKNKVSVLELALSDMQGHSGGEYNYFIFKNMGYTKRREMIDGCMQDFWVKKSY